MPEASLNDLSVAIGATAGVPVVQGEWLVTWTVENRSKAPLTIHEVRIPHDQFRANEPSVDGSINLPPQAARSFTTHIHYDEPPGSTLTYPFVIIRADWNGVACRLFARLRVEADAQGVPHPLCEEVTVRPLIAG